MKKTISLAQGNGGQENNELFSEIFYKAFDIEIFLSLRSFSFVTHITVQTKKN